MEELEDLKASLNSPILEDNYMDSKLKTPRIVTKDEKYDQAD